MSGKALPSKKNVVHIVPLSTELRKPEGSTSLKKPAAVVAMAPVPAATSTVAAPMVDGKKCCVAAHIVIYEFSLDHFLHNQRKLAHSAINFMQV